ncbi:MAG TPA: CopG family transcriptional regulator [Thermoanaerobaculia bacterium]|jgi:hypothetical protein
MKRTTVMLSADLHSRAERQARREGISLGELVRRSLAQGLRDARQARDVDPLFTDTAAFDGPAPADLAAEHDRHLYDPQP